MTCIAAIIHDGSIYMGGDSAATSGNTQSERRDPKVFRSGDFIIGFAGSFRQGQLLAHSLIPPTQQNGQDAYAFMVTDFVDAVRACLVAGSCAREDGDEFMVGYAGRLFVVHSDYQVAEKLVPYDAIGSGAEVALGSLCSTEHKPPRDRLLIALSAAEMWVSDVRGQFNYVTLPGYSRISVAA